MANTPQFALIWDYVDMTNVKEFQVWQCDTNWKQTNKLKDGIATPPNITAPLVISMPAFGTYYIMVVAIASDGVTQSWNSSAVINLTLPAPQNLRILME